MVKGLFDIHIRMKKIDKNGDPLVMLNQMIDWEMFRAKLETIRPPKPPEPCRYPGRKPYDVILMFKIMILQILYNLSEERIEMQVLGRLSFMRFLGIGIGDSVPDANTVWIFKEALKKHGLTRDLFDQFEQFLREQGFQAKQGQIVDASFVHVPVQRNSREETRRIKAGEGKVVKEEWEQEKPAKARQKDIDARWTKKNDVAHYGYKNHVMVDNGGKFIRDYAVTDASVHDSNHFIDLLDKDSQDKNVYADSAYMSAEHVQDLSDLEFLEHLCRKGSRGHALSEEEKANNCEKSRIRCRVEHVFGIMLKRAGDLTMRCIGIERAERTVGLRNLAYNICRYTLLARAVMQ